GRGETVPLRSLSGAYCRLSGESAGFRMERRAQVRDEVMRLRILGCSGGIGGELRTTSMLLDDDVLIDAGTGVGDLSVQQLAQIDHIFVTHSHMDHVTSIPFLLDTVGWQRTRPVTLYAIQETL